MAEGTGLENQQVGQLERGFESLFLRHFKIIYIAGWSSLVARRAHNPKVEGSNPSPATIFRLLMLRLEVENSSQTSIIYRNISPFMATQLSWLERAVHTRKVEGSNLSVATSIDGPVVKWLRHRPFTAVSWVRIPSGSPREKKPCKRLFLLSIEHIFNILPLV